MRDFLKRWWRWGLLSSLFIVVALVAAALRKDPLQDKFDKIEPGMAKERVIEIVGSQPTRRGRWTLTREIAISPEDWEWSYRDGLLWVYFENGRVKDSGLFRTPTIIDEILLLVRQYI
jgi:hypothetical protein